MDLVGGSLTSIFISGYENSIYNGNTNIVGCNCMPFASLVGLGEGNIKWD